MSFKANVLLNIATIVLVVNCKENKVVFKNVTVVAFAYPSLQLVLKDLEKDVLNDTLFSGYHTIEVKNQNIPILPTGSISNMETVKTIHLEANNVSQIQTRAFENLPALTDLRIWGNNFTHLTARAVSCKKLQVLYLNNNSIISVASDAFMDTPDLRILNLDRNKITSIDSTWFKYTANLYQFSMNYNLISQIQNGTFQYLKGNRNISNVLRNVYPNIYIENNRIKSISGGAFRGKINDLFLNNNKLEEISKSVFEDLDNVHWLNLMNNQLECLKEDDYELFLVMDISHIDKNPWDCKCLENVMEWASKMNKSIFANVSMVKCLIQRFENTNN